MPAYCASMHKPDPWNLKPTVTHSVFLPPLSDVPSTEQLRLMFPRKQRADAYSAVAQLLDFGSKPDNRSTSGTRFAPILQRIDDKIALFLDKLAIGQLIPLPRIVEVVLMCTC